jgi:hypothetical protein
LEDPDKPDPGSVAVLPVANTNKPQKGLVTVLLKKKSDSLQAFQFTFDTAGDPSLAKRFLELFLISRKGPAGPVTVSVMHAKQISKEAKKAQPNI